MNAIVKKLKLYRIITVANIFPRFWGKSKKIAREYNLSTFPIFFGHDEKFDKIWCQ